MKLLKRHRAAADAVAEDALTEDAVVEAADAASESETATAEQTGETSRARLLAFRIMPAVAVLLAVVIGALKWLSLGGAGGPAGAEAAQAATDGTIALLTYQPGTVEQDLANAGKLLTGSFRDEYAKLAKDTVIPGAKQRQVSAVASVPAAATVSASADDAVVLVFVNQTIIIGNGAPNSTSSSVRVKLEKKSDRWLISAFDPI